MLLEPGQKIGGKYRIEGRLGVGSTAVVYAAVNERIERRVAIKLLHPHPSHRRPVVNRFEREAQAAARIESDHVVDVLDSGELPNGQRYVVMELLVGESLSCFIERGIDVVTLLGMSLDVLQALDAAHEVGIVHRDLKPSNIFVAHGRGREAPNVVKLLDFGVCRDSELVGEGGTATGVLLGTPRYMAPEQAHNARVDARADLYSLGVVMFYALSRSYPFCARTLPELIARQLTHDAKSLGAVSSTHPAVVELVDRALRRRPEERYQSAAEMAAAVRACLASLGVSRRPSIPEPVFPALQRHGQASSEEEVPVAPSWDDEPPPSAPTAVRQAVSERPPAALVERSHAPGRDTLIQRARPVSWFIAMAALSLTATTIVALIAVERRMARSGAAIVQPREAATVSAVASVDEAVAVAVAVDGAIDEAIGEAIGGAAADGADAIADEAGPFLSPCVGRHAWR